MGGECSRLDCAQASVFKNVKRKWDFIEPLLYPPSYGGSAGG
jgi:hypothetical protein